MEEEGFMTIATIEQSYIAVLYIMRVLMRMSLFLVLTVIGEMQMEASTHLDPTKPATFERPGLLSYAYY
jgi:hypothetical protein